MRAKRMAGRALGAALLLAGALPAFGQDASVPVPPPAGGQSNSNAWAQAMNQLSQMPDYAGAGAASPSDATIGTSVAGDAVIKYDAETDSLVIITDDATNTQIEKVIQTLDKPVPQVLIKVLFLEVTHNKDLDLGVEATFEYGSAGTEDTILTDFGVAGAARGGFYRILDSDFRATLRALATDGKLEVLSRPSVLTRNNQPATITIGQEVPFIRNSRVTDNGQTINTIEYEDIGIILGVTPHITPDRLVEMEVTPEISTLTDQTVPISDTVNAPVIAKRSAETRVVVEDGKTVVIGGLMENNDTSSVQKVPLLGDIPWLGALFRRTITSKTKTELLIMLTPYVVTNGVELDAMTHHEDSSMELAPEAFQKTDKQKEKFFDRLPPKN